MITIANRITHIKMKIWKSFAGEHSANLKIVGTFKTEQDAQKAINCFNDLVAVKDKSNGGNLYFSDELVAVMTTHNFHLFGENDAEQLDYFSELSAQGNRIIVETDEVEIQALIKVLVNYHAQIEIYSKHDYPNKN